MHIHVGTSGFAYKEWIGPFYPQGIRDKALLGWYATQLDTVEINNTFFRFPTIEGLAGWAAQVPDHFRFAFKVNRRITHYKRLRDTEQDVAQFHDIVATLGPRLGPLLFQLPRNMPLNLDALHDVLTCLPPGMRAAFEFKDSNWLRDEVYTLLADHGQALCFNDALTPAPIATADWGYVRLRREQYDSEALMTAAERIETQPWREAYVFVKHEAADSPLLARRLAAMLKPTPAAVARPWTRVKTYPSTPWVAPPRARTGGTNDRASHPQRQESR